MEEKQILMCVTQFITVLLFFTGNKLTCDCRLSWIHILRNETKSKRLKSSLSRLNCIMDTKLKASVGNVKIEKSENSYKIVQINNKKIVDNDYEEEDEIPEDKYYEDAMQDQENGADESKTEYRRRLLDIPLDMLPCANRLVDEATYSPPTQDEVKYYKASSSERFSGSMHYLIVLFATFTVL